MPLHSLTLLRQELDRLGLTGFLVPHADEYQNEYLPPCAERLAWLTGFTGSAGTAIVLQNEAAIFVDGRYTLQVATQVDEKFFSLHNSGDLSPEDWLSRHAAATDRIGYDPKLHTPRELERLRAVGERTSATLVPCLPNPIDRVWHDQPARPSSPMRPHWPEFAGQSSQSKREILAANLQENGIDAAVITAPDSIAWLLNIRGADVPHTPLSLCHVILYATGKATLFAESHQVHSDLKQFLGPDISVESPDIILSALQYLGTKSQRVLLDPAKTNAWIFSTLTESGATLVLNEDPCVMPKACKNPVEIAGAHAAHLRDGVAVCQFLAWLKREAPQGHLTELAAVEYLEECRRKQAQWIDASFPTISGAGPHGAIVHYRATPETNRRLEPDMLYLVDSGGQYLDGTTDITRTVVVGQPSDEHRDRYTRVLQGHIALATAIFPEGTTGSQLDVLARTPLWTVGLDYDHGTGHGVGSFLGVHEGPQRIAKSANTVALRPGMILSNEPGYYKEGAYGIRLENLVVVVKAEDLATLSRPFLAFNTLTVVPFDRALIATHLLSAEERRWVDTYHARVWQCLQSQVDIDTRTWLRGATEPLS